MTLKERLRALAEPCREVDAEIAEAFGWAKETRENQSCEPYTVWTPPHPNAVCGLGPPPRYTTDISAVVELVEREMPDAEIDFSIFRKCAHASVYVGGGQGCEKQFTHKLPAVALLLALIESKEGSKSE